MDGRRDPGNHGRPDATQTIGELDTPQASGNSLQNLKCIDLERRFPSYRVEYEDEAFKQTRDPWHKVIPCRCGHISPAGDTKLWACTNGRRNAAARAFLNPSALEHSRLHSGEPFVMKMDGDDGVNVEFDVEHYATFFKLTGAKKR